MSNFSIFFLFLLREDEKKIETLDVVYEAD